MAHGKHKEQGLRAGMDTFGQDEPQRSVPAFNVPQVVVVLAGVMIVVHVFRAFLSARMDWWVTLVFSFIPARYDDVVRNIPGGFGADLWSFVTHQFLHGDWMHLTLNLAFMVAFGSVLARRFGVTRFLLFSGLSGVCGALAFLASNWGAFVPMIGASGAISGQMAGAVRLLFARPEPFFVAMQKDPSEVNPLSIDEIWHSKRALLTIGVWIFMIVATGIGDFFAPQGASVAWEAHLGGFLFGLFAFDHFDPKEWK
ncbi:MAG: rhomboid family intramembrane serine protease [Hyphomicrobiales bacterium]